MKSDSNELSLLIYEEKSPPKYFKLSKKMLRLFLLWLPLFSLLSITTVLIMFLYFSEIKKKTMTKIPLILQNLTLEKQKLQNQITNLNVENKKLVKLLEVKEIKIHDYYLPLKILNPVPKSEVFDKKLFSLQELKIQRIDNNIKIYFQLANITEDKRRLSGYMIFAVSDLSNINFYPDKIFENNSFELQFNKGEAFATSRFRPFEATFPISKNSNAIIIKIIVYSITGKILFERMVNRDI